MPVATTTQAGREVLTEAAEKILNDAERKRKLARARAAADTLTPLDAPLFPETIGAVPLATVPSPPAAEPTKAARRFSLQTTIAHRGRAITIVCEGMTLDQFCDLLDDRNYAAPAPLPSAPSALPEGYKYCSKHDAAMPPRERQGDSWNSHNVGTKDKPIYCKGYRGSDSPGYEVE